MPYNPKKLIFTVAEVGHHGELISRLIYSWFNVVSDDVDWNGFRGLKFKKASITAYGKPFLYGLFFSSGHFDDIVKAAVERRKTATAHVPPPSINDNDETNMNVAWPICSTIHLKNDMIDTLNTANTAYFEHFSPYKNLDVDCYTYMLQRQNLYKEYYDQEQHKLITLPDVKKMLAMYEYLTSCIDISLIYDIVHGTTKSIDELEEVFGCEPVTSKTRLRAWLNKAHEIHNEKFKV